MQQRFVYRLRFNQNICTVDVTSICSGNVSFVKFLTVLLRGSLRWTSQPTLQISKILSVNKAINLNWILNVLNWSFNLAKSWISLIPPTLWRIFVINGLWRSMKRHISIWWRREVHLSLLNSLFQANRADIVTLDAGEVYSAVKQFGLVAIAKEIYSDGRFASHLLKTSTSLCSEPFYVCGCVCLSARQEAAFCLWLWWQTAAWTSDPCRASGVVTVAYDGQPAGAFLSASCCPETTWAGQRRSRSVKVMKRLTSECRTVMKLWVFQSPHLFLSSRSDVSRFFSASCVPGAAAMAPRLCALCQGQKSYIRQKNYRCETSHSEPFYNSQGALRSESTCEIAVKTWMNVSSYLSCSVTDVWGEVQGMLRSWTI